MLSFSLCPGDLEQCCILKTAPVGPKSPVKPKTYQPSCGQRNVNGIDIRVTSPNDGKKATQIGEWPHVCVLYKNDEFVGGASIIAPGIILTAAHKVE